MKSKVKILLVLGAVAVGALGAGYMMITKGEIKFSENFTLTAHTGCEGTQDNSLESIKSGFENGADIVEFDLNFNSDGKPVLSHDEPQGECVTLDEAFSVAAQYSNLKLNVDVKNTENLKAVAELAEKYNLKNRIFFTGITQNDVEALKQQTPEISYYLNMDVDKTQKHNRDYIGSLADTVQNEGAVGINFHYSALSEELVEIFHQRGLLVSVWTVNKKFHMYKVMKLSPDNITTRYPSQIKKIIENK